MIDFFEQMQSDELNNVMNYVGYLEANDLTLDENGNEVKKDKNKTLTYNPYNWDKKDE
jgi:hypothetical protein